MGPLHGLPVSIKAHVGLEGLNISAGFVRYADRKSPDDAVVVKMLLEAGAVVYVRTTEPQGLVCWLDAVMDQIAKKNNNHGSPYYQERVSRLALTNDFVY